MPLGLADLRSLLEAGELQKLVGEFEGQHLDAKARPYSFASGNDAKREFAKDVAAFANATGGCIIIGAETTVSSLQAGEQVTVLKPSKSMMSKLSTTKAGETSGRRCLRQAKDCFGGR
jgi:predicted HTH transcriptional regulator